MRREVRVEGTDFTRRSQEWTHFSVQSEDDRSALIERFREMSERLKDPWKAQSPTRESIERSLRREIAAHPKDYRFKVREDAGWYLEELKSEATIIDHHVSKGEASAAAVAGIRFGRIYAEFELKLAREELFLVGKKQRDNRDEGIKKWRKGDRDSRVREVDQRAAGTPKSIVFRRIASREGVTWKAIEADYYKAKKGT